jgi:hypothetical protein
MAAERNTKPPKVESDDAKAETPACLLMHIDQA